MDENKNGFELSGEYADIYASVFGDTKNSPEEEINFDPGFRLGARDHSTYEYNGIIVNEGADADYVPKEQPVYEELSSSYYDNGTEEYEDDVSENKDEKRKAFRFFRRGRNKDNEESFNTASEDSTETDSEQSSSSDDSYYDYTDYDIPDEDEDSYGKYKTNSFRQYLGSRIAGVFFKVRGVVPEDASTDTMFCDDEALGQELSPAEATKYYGGPIHYMKLRAEIAAAVLFVMIYISLGGPVPGMLQALNIAIYAVLALQFFVMLLCLDVGTNAVLNVFNGRLNIDFLAVVSCLLTSADAIITARLSETPGHMPLCAVSSLSLYGVLLSSLLSTRGIRKSFRVPAIGKSAYCVTCEDSVMNGGLTLLKSTRPINGFVRRTEEEPIDEENFRKLSPVILAVSFVFALIVTIVKKSPDSALYIFTAVLSPAVPFTALMCFALPFFTGSKRMFSSAAAIAGWSGTYDIGHSKNLIVTDRDLFPDECIEIESVRIFADYPSAKVLSYAGAMIRASQSGLTSAFEHLMQDNNCTPAELDSFEILSGGGLKSLIEGHTVYCGNIDIMRLMDVKVPFKLTSRYSVLLAIDGVLYGIFNISYHADPKVRKALVSLMRSNRHPVFAARDFNITPDMIHDCFDIATDGYDFPPYSERYPLSDAKPSKTSKISAVICREGLGPLTTMADTGRSIFVTTKINTVISVASSIIWLLYSTVALLVSGSLSLSFILLFIMVFSLPILILGTIASTTI